MEGLSPVGRIREGSVVTGAELICHMTEQTVRHRIFISFKAMIGKTRHVKKKEVLPAVTLVFVTTMAQLLTC